MREILQQALDALNDITYNDDNGKCNACGHDYGGHVYGAHYPGCKVDAACDAIRAHLAQPAPVPAELVEAVAKAIYYEWRRDTGYVPWVDGGNSNKQDDARKIARGVVAGAAPVPEEFDVADDGGCPVCGEDGGTSCGMPNCGLLSAPPVSQAEPVGYFFLDEDEVWKQARDAKFMAWHTPLYSHPVPVPLTDEQIDALYINGTKHWVGKRQIARAIEAHHGIVASPEKKL